MTTKQRIKGPATIQFDAKVRELVRSGWGRQAAVLNVASRNPGLHRAMLCETNAGTTDPRVLQAVASGAESLRPPVQRPGVAGKQTPAKPLAGTATRQTAPQASAIPTAPVAPVAPAAAAPAVPVVVVAPLPPTAVDSLPQRVGRFRDDPNFSPYNIIPW